MIVLLLKRLLITAVLLGLLPQAGHAATNVGRANWGADPQSPDTDNITDSATLTINSSAMQVIKKAFVDDGTATEIASGSTVARGTIVKFLIYIDNSTGVALSDVRIEDLLDETAFTYQAGSLKWNTASTNTATAVATIFADANGGTALTDAISGADVGSADTTQTPNDRITFGAHSAQANATLNVPAGKVAAFLFRARVN